MNLAKHLEGPVELFSNKRSRIQSDKGNIVVINRDQLARIADAGTAQKFDLAK